MNRPYINCSRVLVQDRSTLYLCLHFSYNKPFLQQIQRLITGDWIEPSHAQINRRDERDYNQRFIVYDLKERLFPWKYSQLFMENQTLMRFLKMTPIFFHWINVKNRVGYQHQRPILQLHHHHQHTLRPQHNHQHWYLQQLHHHHHRHSFILNYHNNQHTLRSQHHHFQHILRLPNHQYILRLQHHRYRQLLQLHQQYQQRRPWLPLRNNDSNQMNYHIRLKYYIRFTISIVLKLSIHFYVLANHEEVEYNWPTGNYVSVISSQFIWNLNSYLAYS